MYIFDAPSISILREWLYEKTHEMVAEVRLRGKVIVVLDSLANEDSKYATACRPTNFRVRPYMLHTHPKACYLRNGVKYGWPSGQDVFTFLEENLPIHFVLAIEGLYVIKPSTNAGKWSRLKPSAKKSIIDEHDFPADMGTIEKYIQGINNMNWVTVEIYQHSIK